MEYYINLISSDNEYVWTILVRTCLRHKRFRQWWHVTSADLFTYSYGFRDDGF